jgi:hypothetical protein
MAEKNETEMVLGLSKILEGFEYIPGRINARIVKEYDGRDVLQIRDPAGLHQYEVDGNPLGINVDKRFESYLNYLEHLLNEYITEKGNDEGFYIKAAFCEVLRLEGLEYYERYVSLFVLEEFEKSARDSDRNLRLFDIMEKYAPEDYRKYFEQYRSYILSMNTRAKCLKQVKDGNIGQALRIAEDGLKKIEASFAAHNIESNLLRDTDYIVLANIRDNIKKGLSYQELMKHPGLRETMQEMQMKLSLESLSDDEIDKYKV